MKSLWLVTGHAVWVNEALKKETRQISSTTADADRAVDGYLRTWSCTKDDVEHQWWAVDLGQDYGVTSVIITVPLFRSYCNYRISCYVA